MQAIGAERAILGVLMNEPNLVFEIDDVVSPKDFTNSGNRMIYGLIQELMTTDRKAIVDYHTIVSLAEQRGITDFLKVTQNGVLLEALEQTKVNPSSLGHHVNALKAASLKRQSVQLLEELKAECETHTGDCSEIRTMIEDRIFNAMRSFDAGDEDIEKMEDAFEEVINEFADRNGILGLDVGLPRWQLDSAALRNGTVTGLFARAKAGKSQFSAHCAVEVAVKQGLPVLYLDTELQLRMQQMRVAGILSGIQYQRIESGAWKSDVGEIAKIKECFAKVKGSPFYYKNISGRSYKYVIPVIRKWFHKYVGESIGDTPQCLVVYDYIKLMDMGDIKNAAEHQVLGFLLSAIHDVAAQLNIPILALGQLNREALKVDTEATVTGSDKITHNVDSLTLMRAKRQEELDSDGEMRGNYLFKTVLARSGAGHDWNEWINLHFEKSAGQFKEDKRNSEVVEALQGNKAVADRIEDMETGPFGELRQD